MDPFDATMQSAASGATLPQSPAGSVDASVGATAASNSRIWPAARKLAAFPVLMGLLLAGASILGARLNLADPDTWWHVAVGQQILDTHHWPTTDPYSYTAAGTHWIAYEWLGETAIAEAARLGGLRGLAFLQIGLVAIVTLLLYGYAYARCGNWKAACVATAFFLPVASVIFTMRPQLFGYVFLLVTLICLERFRQGHSRALWVLPPLFMIWANTHGTFAFGLAAIGAYFAGGLLRFQLGGLVGEPWSERQRKQLLLTFLLCCVAMLITPYGTQLAAYPIVMAATQPFNVANIQEWQPITFALGVGKYFLAFLLALFLAHVFFPFKYRVPELALLLFGVYAACVHIRFMLVFVMMIVPVVASFFAQWIPAYDPDKDRYAFNLAAIAMILIAITQLAPRQADLDKVVAKYYPVSAIQYLRQHPQPTGMFNDYIYGGYLIWQLGPQHKVFIDGRADLYEYSGVFQDYMHIGNLEPDALTLLDKYGVQSCLTGRSGPLATLLTATPGWKQVYADDLSKIFVRSRPPANSGN